MCWADRCWSSTSPARRALAVSPIASAVRLVEYLRQSRTTNVSGSLTLRRDEERPIASVDMSRMNRILSLDEENLLACIEAGICGRDLERELAARGYTSGHDPDSVELSTLGGWISTNASGMKKNKYGNIEDILYSLEMVLPSGERVTLG
ncbi:MAG: FAD-binding oxidoreductase, partial [Marivivens sp.]|nr:FAD-binding oxidoreductase [Marivivens sp.]